MRISHRYRFIFLSNSQCGSTSIRKMLNPFSDIKSSCDYPYHHHTTAYELYCHFNRQDWNWNDYYVFTTTRNPWDRMVSRYFYGLRNEKSIWHTGIIRAGSFENFIRNDMYELYLQRKQQNLDYFTKDHHGKFLVKKIIKLEEIDKELPIVFNRLHLPCGSIIHINNNIRKRDYRYYYNSEKDINLVKKMFYSDIKFGNYQF